MAKKDRYDITFVKGMFRDSDPHLQGDGTYFYALNATDRSILGEMGYRYFEHSNHIDTKLPRGKYILGSIYMREDRVCLILSSGTGDDEIGVYESNSKTYTTILRLDLNLDINYQIEGLFRLRRGCEETIYFTDNLNPVRHFNLSRPELYRDVSGLYHPEKLNLFEHTSKIPRFENLRVITGGQLDAGKYFIGIQYLDDDLNLTNPILLSGGVKIYNDSLSKNYFDIEGSITIADKEYLNYPVTNKAIEVKLSNLDENYSFYRLVILKYISGTGNITSIEYTSNISTENKLFVYTGDNSRGSMTIEEFQSFIPFYSRAKNILEIDGALTLSNLRGPDIDLCGLQKFASKIKANVVTRKVTLNDIHDRFSPKNPVGEMWLMPGEVYSFGIQYIFEGGRRSPVYHIPGRPEEDIDPENKMSLENFCLNSFYTESRRNSCDTEGYWGEDYLGKALGGQRIRHHRLPTRREMGLPLIQEEMGDLVGGKNLILKYQVSRLKLEEESTLFPASVTVEYNTREGFSTNKEFQLDLSFPETLEETLSVSVGFLDDVESVTNISILVDSELDITVTESSNSFEETSQNNYGKKYITYAFGVNFSNIDIPTEEVLGGYKIIGYQIMRQERKRTDKTILDTGILTPGLLSDQYSSVGMYNPNIGTYPSSGEDIPLLEPSERSEIFKELPMSISGIYGGSTNLTPKEIQDKINLLQDQINVYTFLLAAGPANPAEFEYKLKIAKQEKKAFEKMLTPEQTPSSDREYVFVPSLSGTGEYIPSKYSGNLFGLITPTHKFNSEEHYGLTGIDIEGFWYNASAPEIRDTKIDDVQEGSSYDPEVHKKKYPDFTGFRLWFKSRLPSNKKFSFLAEPLSILESNISELFYLDALFSKVPNGSLNSKKEVFNIGGDNKTGVLILSKGLNSGYVIDKLPYVTLKRFLSEVYSDFQYNPYYRQSTNMTEVQPGDTGLSVDIFEGDVTITSMSPTSSLYIDIVMADRKEKSSTMQFVLGILTVVGSVVGAFFTGGATLSGLSVGLSMISSGLKLERAKQVYDAIWEKGLKKNVFDKDGLSMSSKYVGSDDEIRWLQDNTGEIFFESTVNMGLRYKPTADIPSHLDPFGTMDLFEAHNTNKLTVLDPEKNEARSYRGFPMSELYLTNPDYTVLKKGFIDTHMPPNYDCCSECAESYPERIIYSEKSSGSELQDNYRVFKALNYKDLPSATGGIMHSTLAGGKLYLHTQTALYELPRASRERVQDNLVTFIGDGSYFAMPPNKLVEDSSGNSVGLTHKFSANTFLGVYFFMSSTGFPYIVDNGKLENLGIKGMYFFFKEDYKTPVRADNPAGDLGGYHSVFDYKNSRILLTRVDKGYSWTLGYSLADTSWLSFYSYIPNRYVSVQEKLLSFSNLEGNSFLWEHGGKNSTLSFYDKPYSFEIESRVPTILDAQGNTFTIESLAYGAEYYELNSSKEYTKNLNKTFSKAHLYNSTQHTGEIKLNLKQSQAQDILLNSVRNSSTHTNISRIENRYSLNTIRDHRGDYNSPIHKSNSEIKSNFTEGNKYFESFKLNSENLQVSGFWSEEQIFRDTYVGIRFIFDNQIDTADMKVQYVTLNEGTSFR